MLYALARPVLFRLDAERAHETVVKRLESAGRSRAALKALDALYGVDEPTLAVDVWGLRFPNPLGVAAGFDKNARLAHVLPHLGFGFVEIGTVTARPQEGNPRPRMFRAPEAQGLVNRLGFNNEGAEAVAARLAAKDAPLVPLGVNIGKSRSVANDDAPGDYAASFERLWPHASYVVVNVSSPNTPGLRDLQARESLLPLVRALQTRNRSLAADRGCRPKPLLVKLSPDLADEDVADVAAGLLDVDVAGIVATNTTVRRDGVSGPVASEAGGLSGRPLRDRSTEVVRLVHKATDGRMPIVGVGGVSTDKDAWEKVEAGASLVQAYTGFIYAGPDFARRVCRGLAARVKEGGFANFQEAVGAAHKR